jgi:hypothetical protein
MLSIILLGGALAILMAAGATTLAFESVELAQHRAAPAKPIQPASLSKTWEKSPPPLSKPWQDLRDEMALP